MIRLDPNFLDDIEKFSGKSLNKKDDLAAIIEVYKSSKKFEDFALKFATTENNFFQKIFYSLLSYWK